MFFDALLLVSDAQALSATAVSTNTIDLGAPAVARRIGSGEQIGFLVTVDVAADFTTTDETYSIQAISSASANLSSPTVLSSVTLTSANRPAGSKIYVPVPKQTPIQRYIGLNYVLGGTTPTITVTAALVLGSMVEDQTIYAKGYSN